MLASKLQPFITRYDEISALLVQPDILNDIKRITELSKEQSDLEELVQKARLYLDNIQSIKENKTLLDDKELGDLAKEEIKEAWELQIMTKYDIAYEQVSSMVADGVLTMPQYYDIEVVSITKISED